MRGRYRECEAEDFLDEVGGRDGAEDSLDAVLFLLHVGLLVELIHGKTEKQTSKQNTGHASDEHLDSTCCLLNVQGRVRPGQVAFLAASLTFNIVSNVALSPCFSTVKYTWEEKQQRYRVTAEPPAGH